MLSSNNGSNKVTSTEALSRHCYEAALESCEFVCQQLRSSQELWVG